MNAAEAVRRSHRRTVGVLVVAAAITAMGAVWAGGLSDASAGATALRALAVVAVVGGGLVTGAAGAGLIVSPCPRSASVTALVAGSVLVVSIATLVIAPGPSSYLVQVLVAMVAISAAALLVGAVVWARTRLATSGTTGD